MRWRRPRISDELRRYRKDQRRQFLRRHRVLLLFILTEIVFGVYTTVVAWFATLDTGDARFMQYALLVWGVLIGMESAMMIGRWRRRIALWLYFGDCWDGICPDRGAQMTPKNAWKWREKRLAALAQSATTVNPRPSINGDIARCLNTRDFLLFTGKQSKKPIDRSSTTRHTQLCPPIGQQDKFDVFAGPDAQMPQNIAAQNHLAARANSQCTHRVPSSKQGFLRIANARYLQRLL